MLPIYPVEFTVTADTKEEAIKGIDSLRNYLEDESGFSAQRCYCGDEVKQNKQGKWVAWEMINCLRDSDDYESIKEAYNEWKRILKTTPIAVETLVETKETLIETVVNLSAGTIASISREAGITEKDSTVTYEDVDRIVNDWVEFIRTTDLIQKKWQDSWKQYVASKKPKVEEGNMKKIGKSIYVHKTNVGSLNLSQLELIWKRLKQLAETDYPCNTYEIIKIKDDTVSFIECEGWDKLREPIVGNAYCVKSDGSVKFIKKKEKNPQIYHHKWMFVANDYNGFDVEKEKEWSKKWQLKLPSAKEIKSKIGYKNYWEALLREYGLEK